MRHLRIANDKLRLEAKPQGRILDDAERLLHERKTYIENRTAWLSLDEGDSEPLSERELEVLQLIAKGLTNREISDRLYLSLNTIKVHITTFTASSMCTVAHRR